MGGRAILAFIWPMKLMRCSLAFAARFRLGIAARPDFRAGLHFPTGRWRARELISRHRRRSPYYARHAKAQLSRAAVSRLELQ